MKLDLPDVTLIVAETRAHALMKIALDEMLAAVKFGEILVCSDNFNILRTAGARHIGVADWPSKIEWERFIWEGLAHLVQTSHAMFMEWDAGLFDSKMWNPAFLEFDYIGAPWGRGDGRDVGNGGLSMRSANLMNRLACHADEFPVIEPGDDTLCRVYRSRLEEQFDLKWAPEDLAHQFSFECARPFPTSRHFGYHAMRNWPHVLDRDRLVERTRLAVANRYIAGTGMLDQLFNAAPWLRQAAAA